ncbi:hypothetical protein CPC08DRAFT_771567 [Agrocybe pediades]|nr:hypothetical protein CPC08DRAFT_771567 [Agrocybe pediades]
MGRSTTPILWDSNKHWTQRAINYLLNTPKFRIKLFSDSTSQAKSTSRVKIQAKEGKLILFEELADHIFSQDEDKAVQKAYQADKSKYAKSTKQQFTRLKKTYQQYRAEFKVTGGGVKEGDDAINLTEKIQEAWPFYEDLHRMWSELPNYNPVGVSTSTPGQNFGAQAAKLFLEGRSENDASSGVEDAKFDGVSSNQVSETGEFPEGEPGEDEGDPEAVEIRQSQWGNVKMKEETSRVKHEKKSKPNAGPSASTHTKKRPLDAFSDIQTMELKDAAARRDAKNAIRMRELENEAQRHQLEREKHQAKVRKMELEIDFVDCGLADLLARHRHTDTNMSMYVTY